MLKIRNLLLILVAACLYVACKSDPAYDKATQLAIDDDIIAKELAATGNTTFTKTADGLYYSIIKPGVGATPIPTDNIGIHYVGRVFLNQIVFDSTINNVDTTKFILSNSIEGWQKGIPLIKPGGRIRLIVPSALAYQNRQLDTLLKANTILDFDIQLISIIPPVTTK